MLLEAAGYAEHAATLESASVELEATRSGARVVSASDAERRRLERDLHDGAQQRLVSLAIQLRLLAMDLAPDSDQARLLEVAQQQLAASLQELRELAAGLHPAVLDRGLDDALTAVARQSSAAGGRPCRRPSAPGRTCRDRGLLPGLRDADQRRQVRARDRSDGCGPARERPPHRGGRRRRRRRRRPGTWLRAPGPRRSRQRARRTVHVSSPAGQGTTVRAEIPCPPR